MAHVYRCDVTGKEYDDPDMLLSIRIKAGPNTLATVDYGPAATDGGVREELLTRLERVALGHPENGERHP